MDDSNTTPKADAPVPAERSGDPPTPRVVLAKRSRFSWIWILPIAAALVGASLVVRNWMLTGPRITISFDSADGLAVDQTKLRYRDVNVGTIVDIQVAPDRQRVIVTAQLERDGAEFITQKDSRFWVVRPRLGLSGVSGLGTLLSGAYIGVDAPHSLEKSDKAFEFTGLERPPEVISGRPGKRFVLTAPELGSLDLGSPVYYKGTQVGQVISYELDPEGKGVQVQVFVDAPNDRFVTDGARFWNVSGVNMSLDPNGFTVRTYSMVAALAGGLAFEQKPDEPTTLAKSNAQYELFPSKEQAMADPDGPAVELNFHFHQSVRGLAVGSKVEFRGMELGKVQDVDLEYDFEAKRFYALVKARIYPQRFGRFYELIASTSLKGGDPVRALVGPMIDRGLRAQMRPASLITGRQYIALEFFDKVPKVEFDPEAHPLVIPVIGGDFDRLQEQVSDIVTKIAAVPFDQIGKDLQRGLADLGKVLKQMDKATVPQLTGTLKSIDQAVQKLGAMLETESPMNTALGQTLSELNRSLRSLRDLSDTLQNQPSSLLRGRSPDVLPEPNP
ncbi:PqiB family protein [Alcaligenes sp. SDU_A2]|uniref:PqiB family protein n=1 Tax=Alcaligenes sp. SDU_A2 TaxID=3136634 RepID=UPI00311F7138